MFQPTINTPLTVALPGESLRAPVVQVVNKNTVFVELMTTPLNPAKSHSYRKGDLIACRRVRHLLGERWEAFDDRVLAARPQNDPEPPLPARRKRKAAAKKKAAPKKAAKGGKRATGRR